MESASPGASKEKESETAAKAEERIKAQQAMEAEKRKNFEAQWAAMDYWAAYYKKENPVAKIKDIKNLPQPLTDSPDGNEMIIRTTQPSKENAVHYGSYTLVMSDGKKDYEVNIKYDETGIRPIPPSPEGWSAAIDFLIEKQRADTIVLKVSPNPNFPDDALNTLIMMTKMCIEKGVAGEPHEDARTFLKNANSAAMIDKVPQERQAAYMENLNKLQEMLAVSVVNMQANKLDAYKDMMDNKIKTFEEGDDRIDKLVQFQEKQKSEKEERVAKELEDLVASPDKDKKIEVVAGDVVGAEIDKPASEAPDKDKKIEVVAGDVVGVEADKLASEAPDKDKKTEDVVGDVLGAEIDKLVSEMPVKDNEAVAKDLLQGELDKQIKELEQMHIELAKLEKMEEVVLANAERLVKADKIIKGSKIDYTEKAKASGGKPLHEAQMKQVEKFSEKILKSMPHDVAPDRAQQKINSVEQQAKTLGDTREKFLKKLEEKQKKVTDLREKYQSKETPEQKTSRDKLLGETGKRGEGTLNQELEKRKETQVKKQELAKKKEEEKKEEKKTPSASPGMKKT